MIKLIKNFLNLIIFGHYHTWGEWRDYNSGIFYQRRYCKNCGKAQEREV